MLSVIGLPVSGFVSVSVGLWLLVCGCCWLAVCVCG